MPLQRKLGSSRPGIWGVDFMMMTHEGAPVPCNVTRGGIAALGQVAVFDQCRDEIEAVASQKWDCSRLQDGKVIVKPEDLVEAGLA